MPLAMEKNHSLPGISVERIKKEISESCCDNSKMGRGKNLHWGVFALKVPF